MSRKKVYKPGDALLLLGSLAFAAGLSITSCASEPDVPVVLSAVVTTTTVPVTTTLPPPVIVQAPKPVATTTTTVPVTPTTIPKPPEPSISEPEFRNLYGTARLAREDIFTYRIDSLLPEKSAATLARFVDVSALYDMEICKSPYNGVSAYKISGALAASARELAAIVEEGLPLRAAEAARLAAEARASAASLGVQIATQDRFVAAESENDNARAMRDAKEYRSSIAGFELAAALYDSAKARAVAEVARDELGTSGLSHYSPYHSAQANQMLDEEELLYQKGTLVAIREGIAQSELASADYRQALEWGLRRLAEDKRLLASKAQIDAKTRYSDIVAPQEYSEGLRLLEQGDTLGYSLAAADKYNEATLSFDTASAKSLELTAQASIALAAATEAAARQVRCLDSASAPQDIHISRALELLDVAKEKIASHQYEYARIDALDSLNHTRLSERLLGDYQKSLIAGLRAEITTLEADLAAAKNLAATEAARADLERSNTEAQIAALRTYYEQLLAAKSSAEAGILAAEVSRLEIERARLATENARLAAEREALARAQAEAKAEADRLATERALADPKILAIESIALAEVELRRAESRNAANNYPETLASGKTLIVQAKTALEGDKPELAASTAGAAKSILAGIPEFAPLPARYKVRLIVPNTDSLWNISAYSFVYGNPYLWTRLYAANRDLMYDRDDPHLILPNQVLTIPSLWGEYREGIWDPKKTYPDIKEVTGTSRK